MSDPFVSRAKFPDGYIENPKSLLSWQEVEQRLVTAKNYWLGSVHPDQRPHAVPVWGVWLQGRFYFDGSPQTRHARNIFNNPAIGVHLESGDEAVILEGVCRMLSQPPIALTEPVARAYREKYTRFGYSPQADQWDGGGLFEVTPGKVLAWTHFTVDPTRFMFENSG